ncbi:tRNA-specific adenosine deaminase [Rhodococcus sp. ACS1]|uniref:nucleoside deaminase n=1 Tax=Rhodococcus sp. ACS1 TaxID=2028570 RepID=UPI000BB163EB|nr:nucleoside deaminase [Rhodococcus sp. ACS1]PBC39762.1 tRNA-specific adenosine deaminase [Rhodococcus sp. ACS1]
MNPAGSTVGEATDRTHLLHTLDLARTARADGNRPFGSLLVDAAGIVLLTATNTAVTDRDVTAHAETNVVRAASASRWAPALASTTLYSSAEPCPMCAGAIYLSGIGRVVYALAAKDLASFPGASDQVRTVPTPMAEVLAGGDGRPEIRHHPMGQAALEPHVDYWTGQAR